MGLVVVAAIFLALIAVPVVRSFNNPVVTVADVTTSARPYDDVDADVARLLGSSKGYELQMVLPGTYTLSYRRTPGWALVLGVVTFPLGILIMLLARETLTLTISVTAAERGTRVTVVGQANQKLARAIGAAIERRLEWSPTASEPPARD